MITFFSSLSLIDLPISLIIITAIKVFPAPVSNTAMVFLFIATSNASIWYLQHKPTED